MTEKHRSGALPATGALLMVTCLIAVLTVLTVLLPAAQDPVFSGPQPGEALVPFEVTGVIGDEANQKLDLVTRAAGKPCVLVFVHERTRPAFGLANLLMRLVAQRKSAGLTGGLIFLTSDPTDTANWVGNVRKYFPAGTTLGISRDGLEGPGAYGLNRNVAVTVLVANKNTVVANFALVQPSNQVDGPKIFQAIADVLGEKPVPDIADFAQQPGRRMRPKTTPDSSSPGTDQDPEIRRLLQPLIQKTATDEQVDAAAEKIVAYATAHDPAKQQIGDRARRIISAGKLQDYGTAKCQQYLQTWAKEWNATDSDRDSANTKESPGAPRQE